MFSPAVFIEREADRQERHLSSDNAVLHGLEKVLSGLA
jgi:hypothetical protein